jgi:hypothetical protein
VRLKIANGQLNPQQALMQGMYRASDDLGLLPKMAKLFKPKDIDISQISLRASPAPQRQSGQCVRGRLGP